jgi:PAS domain S-box-containing protein
MEGTDSKKHLSAYLSIAVMILLLTGLYFTSLYSYLLFHTLAEMFSVGVSVGVFAVAWHSRRFAKNNYLLVVGASFLFVGIIDTLHALAYKGLGVFEGYDANLPTQLWVSARYLQTTALFIAPFLINVRLNPAYPIAGYGVITAFLLASIFYWKTFPDCFIEGSGLTTFKKVSEYMMSLILIGSMAGLSARRKFFDKEVFRLLLGSMFAAILSELSFTLYISVYGIVNNIGHLLKIVSFYLIYRAIIETGLERPYELLFRDVKQREELLAGSEKKYRDIVDNALVGVFKTNLNGDIIFVNRAMLRLFEFDSPEDFAAEGALARYKNPRDRQLLIESLKRAGRVERFELATVTKTGRDINLLLNATLDGDVLSGIAVDISEQKRYEERLEKYGRNLAGLVQERTRELYKTIEGLEIEIGRRKETEERLKETIGELREAHREIKKSRDFAIDLLNKLPSPIWRSGTDAKVNYVNSAWLGFTGRQFEDEIGDGWAQGIHPDDSYIVMKEYRSSFDARMPFTLIYRLRNHEGQYRWVIDYGAPFNDLDGSFAGYLGSCYDFTYRKETEDELRESESRFRQLFEQNENAIIIFRADKCEIIDANPSAARLYGYTRKEIREKGPSLFIPEDVYKEFEETMLCAAKSDGICFIPMTHIKKDGTSIVVVTGQTIALKEHESDVIYCIFYDISEKMRLQEEAKIRQAQLIHSNKMASLGLMASGIAHEINNPNNFILSNAQMIKDMCSDAVSIMSEYHKEFGDFSVGGMSFLDAAETLPCFVSSIIEGSMRIKNIVDNLRDFARPERAAAGEIDINKAVRTSAAILANEIKRYTDNFSLSLDEDMPRANGSGQKIEQVVINLLINGLHALPDKKRGIEVSTRFDKDAQCAIIKIRDEGIGIPKNNLEKIKEPFFSTKLDSGGSGLGLFISHFIVEEHGGSLELESEEGKGTTAVIKLPAMR